MASAMAGVLAKRLITSSKAAAQQLAGKRTLHSSGPRQMSGHGGGEKSIYSNDYIHAPHMYDFPHMKSKRLKMGFMVFGSLALGISVPVYATHYQMVKSGFL